MKPLQEDEQSGGGPLGKANSKYRKMKTVKEMEGGTAEGTKENQKRGSHESQVIEISRRKELLTVPNQAEEPNRVRLRGEEPNELSLIR